MMGPAIYIHDISFYSQKMSQLLTRLCGWVTESSHYIDGKGVLYIYGWQRVARKPSTFSSISMCLSLISITNILSALQHQECTSGVKWSRICDIVKMEMFSYNTGTHVNILNITSIQWYIQREQLALSQAPSICIQYMVFEFNAL